jgi:hypothetical protein
MHNVSSLMMNPQNMMSKFMEQLGDGDPQLAMMVQMMQHQQQSVADPDDDYEAKCKELEIDLAHTQQNLDSVRAEGKRLLAAHKIAVGRLSDLAAALGACGLCWGEDPDCLGCRGRGHVGMIRPDPEIRARLLGPARTSHKSVEHLVN